MHVSRLSRHGVVQRSRFDVALLTPCRDNTFVEVDGSDFDYSAQLLCGQPLILAEAVAQLKAAGGCWYRTGQVGAGVVGGWWAGSAAASPSTQS